MERAQGSERSVTIGVPGMQRPFLSHRVVTRLRNTRGNSLVEAAIILPLLMLLTLGIVEFATMFWVWLALQNGASQGTRYAVTGNLVEGQSREESIKSAMRQATPSLTLDDGAFVFSHLPPGGGGWAGGAGGPGDIIKVTVNYAWTPMIPLIGAFFPGGDINFAVESAMKNEARFE